MYKPISMNYLKRCSICICFGISFGIHAQELKNDSTASPDGIITDRPDATESPFTVPQGFLQIETGAFYTSFEANNVKEVVLGYNTTLLRHGILDNLELRLGWNFEEGQTTVNGVKMMNVQSGFSPLLAGMKVNIAKENGWIPTIGFLAHLMLPFTAGDDYRPETTGADFRFSFAHTLSEKSSLGYNFGAQWGDDSSELAYIYTFSYGYSILDYLGVYTELYGDLPEDSSSNHYWDAGITYLVLHNLQLDATVGSSISKGQDLLLSVGASYRIPK